MKNNQTDFDNEPKYPEPFESGWMDVGSRTIDLGQNFHFAVDEDGFHAQREHGIWSVQDLFGEMSYWPTLVVWSDSNERLAPLLSDAAQSCGLASDELRRLLKESFHRYDFDINSYLDLELATSSDAESLLSTRAKFAEHFQTYQIPGLPSHEFRVGTSYAGLTLEFNQDGWTATLYGPEDEELFHDEFWEADTFDELLTTPGEYLTLKDVLPWTRDELAAILIASDRRWEPLVTGQKGIRA